MDFGDVPPKKRIFEVALSIVQRVCRDLNVSPTSKIPRNVIVSTYDCAEGVAHSADVLRDRPRPLCRFQPPGPQF